MRDRSLLWAGVAMTLIAIAFVAFGLVAGDGR
ncbi:MAG: hypothetical protein RL190_680 [Actinomycetota bacterium]